MADAQPSSVPAGVCPEKPHVTQGPPLFQNGNLTFQAHHVGWIVASFFAIISTAVSIWLINKHLTWYTCRRQQRQIVRLLLMVPIYATISCLAYFFWNHAIPLSLIRDAYEGIILASFFYLLLQYLAPTPAEQKEYFRTFVLEKWAWPFGYVKRKPDGLYFLQLMKWAILQYCWIRPLTTFAAVILNTIGIYCETSWSPRFGSVWILIIVSLSVTVAMFCLIQFYLSISDKIKQHKPLLQLFSIKAIIFLMFWQSSFLSVLHSLNVIKDTKYMTAEDINVGFAALLQTFEMVLFSFLHVKCFSYLPYRKSDQNLRTKKGAALRHALDFRDFWRETRDGSVYMWRTARGKEAEPEARRRTHFERAMGRNRNVSGPKLKETRNHHLNGVESDSDSDPGLPRQRPLLSVDYGPPFSSEFEKAAGKRRRGENHDRKGSKQEHRVDEETGMLHGHNRRERSWWSRFRERISSHGEEQEMPSGSRAREKGAAPFEFTELSLGPNSRQPRLPQIDLDESPPPSLLGRGRRSKGKGVNRDKVDGLPVSENKPLLIWDPSTHAPPVLVSPTPIPEPPTVPQKEVPRVVPEAETSPLQHRDTILGRLFIRSIDSESEDDANLLPPSSRRQTSQERDNLVQAIRENHTLDQASPAEMPLSPDIPTIPSPIPSPARVPAAIDEFPAVPATRSVLVPAHPIPIPHQSLSIVQRPGILKADEEGRIPTLDLPRHDRPPFQHSAARPELHQAQQTRSGPRGMERRGREPIKGPRRPENIVMPSPLSPARFPIFGGQMSTVPPVAPNRFSHPQAYVNYHQAPIIGPNGSGFRQNPGPPFISSFAQGSRFENQQNFRPVVQFNEEPPRPSYFNISPVEMQNPVQTSSRKPKQHRRERESHPQSAAKDNQSGRRRRSRSPFGIKAAESDVESLPRHPAMRNQTARRRRESQPLPDPPIDADGTNDNRASRHFSVSPPQKLDLPVTPSIILTESPNSPSSPSSSPHTDSRYPRGTVRANYFEEYAAPSSPYLTNIMTKVTPPEIPVLSSSPFPTPVQSRRLKRR